MGFVLQCWSSRTALFCLSPLCSFPRSPQALYSLVARNFAGRSGEAGAGVGGPAAVKGLSISVNNTLMELRSICNHPFIR